MKKILVIDDDDALRSELLEALSFEGYNVVGAENGRDGVLAAQAHLPDLIICDMQMPGLNGLAATIALRQDSVTRHIPIILLSAANEQLLNHGLELGAAAWLPKPCSLDQLSTAIKAQLGVRPSGGA